MTALAEKNVDAASRDAISRHRLDHIPRWMPTKVHYPVFSDDTPVASVENATSSTSRSSSSAPNGRAESNFELSYATLFPPPVQQDRRMLFMLNAYDFNATESHGAEVGLCSLSVALPIQSEACVVEYHREGTPSDLRDNMIGEDNAEAIVAMNLLVTAVLKGPMTQDEALRYFMETFGPVGAIRDDAEREFDMTLKAPIVPVFPPEAAVRSILKRAYVTPLSPSPATVAASASATKIADEL